MKKDRFWETFWLSFLGLAFLAFFSSMGLFFFHINKLDAAAVGVAFDPTRDPFENGTYHASVKLQEGYAYRDALPLGMAQWGWDTTRDWSSTERAFDGSASLKVSFNKQWSGFGFNGFNIARSSYNTLSLAVYPDASVGDLYIEIYDEHNKALARQSLGWYAPGGSLVPDEWQELSIPLQNLLNGDTKSVTGITISTTNPGTAYFDAVQFTADATEHAPWVQPVAHDEPPYNPFATSTPASLPYAADFSEADFSQWHSYYGLFTLGKGSFTFGPQAPASNDSLAVMRGGLYWSDYQVEAQLNWGAASVFSILTRMTDASDFASCAFSHYGQNVQLYLVKNGVSTELAQTPALAIPDYAPWENVKVGASAVGQKVSCYVNGQRVLWMDISDLPSEGSVGIEAWDQNAQAAPHVINSFSIHSFVGE